MPSVILEPKVIEKPKDIIWKREKEEKEESQKGPVFFVPT